MRLRSISSRWLGLDSLPISMCIQDSREMSWAVSTPSARSTASSSVKTSCSWPVTSRRTRICGCTTMCTSRLCSLSSIVTESTRNGMSSVTTSTTVWPPADQPCSATVGVKTRMFAVP